MSAWSTVHEKIVVDVVACSALMVLADEHSWEVTHLYRYILYTHTYQCTTSTILLPSMCLPVVLLSELSVSPLNILQSLFFTLRSR